jgi:hypothetical protein
MGARSSIRRERRNFFIAFTYRERGEGGREGREEREAQRRCRCEENEGRRLAAW